MIISKVNTPNQSHLSRMKKMYIGGLWKRKHGNENKEE